MRARSAAASIRAMSSYRSLCSLAATASALFGTARAVTAARRGPPWPRPDAACGAAGARAATRAIITAARPRGGAAAQRVAQRSAAPAPSLPRPGPRAISNRTRARRARGLAGCCVSRARLAAAAARARRRVRPRLRPPPKGRAARPFAPALTCQDRASPGALAAGAPLRPSLWLRAAATWAEQPRLN